MEQSFPRSIQALTRVFAFTKKVASSYSLNDRVQYVLDLAVEEFFTNMVKYNPSGHGDIRITMDVNEHEMAVRLIDPDSDLSLCK